jgi:uncharacterized protein involved in type VI secretion and phage assembly
MAEQGNGITVGVVTDLDDPERIGRVQVRFPHLDDQHSYWARLATLVAGPNRGAFFRPQVDDEVLVAFEHGDPRRAYILGGVWSKPDPPPKDDGQATKNNWWFFCSRSGQVIKLDDTAGAERIEIVDKDAARRVVVDSANQKVVISCDSGDVEVSAPAGTVRVTAGDIDVQASKGLKLQAGGTLTIKAPTVNIN